MRLHGFCTECRRVKRVAIRYSSQWLTLKRDGVVSGICDQCQAEADRPQPPQGPTVKRRRPVAWLPHDEQASSFDPTSWRRQRRRYRRVNAHAWLGCRESYRDVYARLRGR